MNELISEIDGLEALLKQKRQEKRILEVVEIKQAIETLRRYSATIALYTKKHEYEVLRFLDDIKQN